MHELSLINNLLHKIKDIAQKENARKVTGVKVRLGALSHISADHFREHFMDGTRNTIADGATLETEVSNDLNDAHAQEILLLSIDVDQ